MLVPAASLIPKIKDSSGRLVFEPLMGGGEGPAGTYYISAARYAKGKCVITTSGFGGWKSRACRLADVITRSAYVGRSGGYTATVAQAERFVWLYEAGWDASSIAGTLEPPRVEEVA